MILKILTTHGMVLEEQQSLPSLELLLVVDVLLLELLLPGDMV